ncbi:MAG: sigma factor, partial [Butyricimonas faecihominis]
MEVCQNDDSAFLLMRFNQRDTSAFAMIYTKFFTELHVYANRLYTNTSESAEDAVQEAFCYLWERHDVIFDSLTKIKAFLFVAIKNRYKNHVSHLGVEQKYRDVL